MGNQGYIKRKQTLKLMNLFIFMMAMKWFVNIVWEMGVLQQIDRVVTVNNLKGMY